MRPADPIIVALAVLVNAALFVFIGSAGGEATSARISAGTAQEQRVDLSQNTIVEIAGRQGPSVLEVADGKIRFVASTCRNRDCVRHGWMSLAGDVAACLPNGVSVLLDGPQPRYDAINF